MALTREQEALLPSDHDVAFYREHGWYRSLRILPDSVLDAAFVGISRHFDGERDWILPPNSGFSDWKPGDLHTVRNAEVVALQNRQLRQLIMYPLLGAMAARLAGTSAIRYFADSLVYKPGNLAGNESVVGWHTDRSYWGTCSSDNMLTVWIPFQDCTEEMGPVLYIDRSHQWPGTADMRTFNCRDLSELERRISSEAPLVKIPMTLRRGEVCFHHCRTIHGSGPNRSTQPRIAYAIHMQDAANRFRIFLNAKGERWRIYNDHFARKQEDGLPDYMDPEVFPQLWVESDSAP
jgi:hypothetical protein